ncbi:DNA-binding response OmpR family regulator [Haloferula luteola]|uniref:DNA-binding response OmpR family regulator n=1 Tax=Haloferula luteola TaxID=595692 RepID=A0A840VFA1_9BACT|nr:response regulator transcription factor [Haloferula luteola]MBB5352490.1 DNA-binding response OmpR family regulator [Haloferula luteola]
METTVLVIEDDAAVRQGVVDALEYSGYRTLQAADGLAGLELARRGSYQLMLLDLMMPGRDGFAVLEALKRDRPGQPVIILSARGEEEDRVRGLRLGADDYVLKPFSVRELLARVEAVLRRSCERPAPVDQWSIPGGAVDFSTGELTFSDGGREMLSEREAALLRYLLGAEGRVVTRAEILRHVWGLDPARTETRTLDMHVMHLRTKLRDVHQSLLVTVRGKGWRLNA